MRDRGAPESALARIHLRSEPAVSPARGEARGVRLSRSPAAGRAKEAEGRSGAAVQRNADVFCSGNEPQTPHRLGRGSRRAEPRSEPNVPRREGAAYGYMSCSQILGLKPAQVT